MTDTEIIKALECCPQHIMCGHCPFRNVENCMSALYVDALDLIKRQKAEIERLNEKLTEDINDIQDSINRITDPDAIDGQYKTIDTLEYSLNCINNIAKEMVGEDNA